MLSKFKNEITFPISATASSWEWIWGWTLEVDFAVWTSSAVVVVWTISWTQILIGYYRIFHWVHPYKVVVFLLRQPFRLFHFSKAIVQVFIFFKIFYLFFCRKFRRYSRNLLSAMFLFFSRTFFFINRPMRSKNHSKWKTASIFSQYQIFKRQSHHWIPNFV